jgi:hypothetical protein
MFARISVCMDTVLSVSKSHCENLDCTEIQKHRLDILNRDSVI